MKEDFKGQLESYFSDEMDANERKAFLELLEQNLELKKEFEANVVIYRQMEDTELMELKDKLEKISKEQTDKKAKQRRLSITYIVAASMALLLSFGVLLNRSNLQQNELAVLYTEYYEVYKVSQNFRSWKQIENKSLVKALNLYEKADYKNARLEFEKILRGDPTNFAIKFYLGITYIETGEPEKAISLFDELAKDKGNLFLEQAEWYLGICYLKTEKKTKALGQFTQIAASDGFFKDKAKEILDKL